MDLSLLIPFLSKTAAAGLSVSPEEVVIQLKKENKKKDKDNETVDGDVVDHDQQAKALHQNIEGKLMEGSFKELDIQAAVEKALEQKKKGITSGSKSCCESTKTASYWDLLSSRLNK